METNPLAQWIRVAAVADCPPGSIQEFLAGSHIVALANVEGQFFALDGICPHQGGPLGKGRVTGSVVTCPWHGWQFDLRTGTHCLNTRLTHPTFPVRVEDGAVFVAISDE